MAANYFDKYDQQAGNYFDKYDAPVAAKPEKTGMIRAAADIPVQVGRGIAQGVKALSDAFGSDNPVSRAASGVEGYLGELLSAQAKNDQAEIARIMKEAEDKGVGANLVAAAKAIATAPADTLAQVFGTAVPVIAGGLVGSLTRLGASAVGYGIGATMGAGTVKGSIYEAVKQELKANNVPEAEAERRAQEAQAYGGENIEQILLGAGLGAAASRGAERIITDLIKKGAMKPSALPAATRIPTAAVTEALPEAAQAAQERIAQNIALQREGYDVPTMRGVAGQAAFEGLAGAGLGAIAGAAQRTAPEAKVTKETETPEGKIAGRTTVVTDEETAARLREEAAEPEMAEAEAPKPVTGEAGIVRPEEVPPISVKEVAAARPKLAELRAQIDREAQLQQQAAEAGIDFERRMAEEQIAAAREMRAPEEGAKPEYVDLRPLRTPLAQRQAMAVAQEEARQQGIDPGRLELVPHPKIPNALTLSRKPEPVEEVVEEPTIAPEEAQARIEQAALTGKELQRQAEDEPRQIVLNRALQNIEERGGIASPEEARIVQEANIGKPYDRVDESLGRTLSTDEQLTQATGIALAKRPREAKTYPPTQPFEYTPALQGEKKPEPVAEIMPTEEEATVKAYVDSFARPNTPAARAFKQAYDRGDITNADIMQAVQSKLPVDEVAQRLQEAAKQAPGERITPAGIRYALRGAEKNTEQQVSDFEQTLRTALNKFGLKDVGVKLIDGMREEGSYAQQLIRIAADSANPIRTLRHEAIHALRELGFFTPQQWQSLSKMAKDKWIDQYLKQRNVDGKPLKAGEESRYDAYMREYESDMEKITEEAVADAFADFDATKPPAGLMSALLTRLRNLFQAIKSALTKVESPEQIFGKVERGELAAGAPEKGKEAKSLRDRATANFLRWFGDSKVVDEKGEPLVIYRGVIGESEGALSGQPRTGYAAFGSDSPQVAATYSQPEPGTKETGAITPLYIKADRVIEFPVDTDRDGRRQFDKFEFDRRAKALQPGEVLVVRQVIDIGPRASLKTDPTRLYSYPSDIYAWNAGTSVKSAIGNNGEYSLTDADIRKSLRKEEAKPTPTTAGQQALDTINQLGMGVKEPEQNLLEKTKEKLERIGEAPAKETMKNWQQAVSDYAAKLDGLFFSADAPFENKIRQGRRQDLKGLKEFIGTMLTVSQSQAVQLDAVATQAMLIGKPEYREDLYKWVAVEDEANDVKKAEILDRIAEKYGLTKEEAVRVAHTYLSAANYEGILKRNAEIKERVKALRNEDKSEEADKLSAAKVFVTPEQAAMVQPGLAIADQIPEVKEITTLWNKQRENVKNVLVETGLWTPEYAEAMMDNVAYVPFYREMEDEVDASPEMMIRGLQVKAKEHKLKGSSAPVADVFENMARWQQYALNRAMRNHKALQMIDAATEMKLGDKPMAVKVSEPGRGKNITRVWRDGKQEYYEMADPLFVDAFKSLGAVSIPAVKWFTAIANRLREFVVLYPLFSVAQLPQDAVAAIFASGLKPRYAFKIPYLAVKQAISTYRGTNELHNELKKFGVVGVRDFNSAVMRQDAEITAGIKMPPGGAAKVKFILERIAMSADNAVRQAVYQASMEQPGVSQAEALEKAFEIINFRRRGSSKMLNLIGQTVPFFYAYLSAQRVAYKTITGTGISPGERKAAIETLIYTSGAVMALSFIYAMANGDDEAYEKTPTNIRDRSINIPGTNGFRIPLRPDFFLFPKIIAEHTYHLMAENGFSDPAKFKRAMWDNLANAALSPNVVPQAFKPALEIGINYSFFDGRPIVGFFEQNKEAGRQFNESTSEFAKMMGGTGLSPQKVDHFIRGYFGSVGGLFLYATNFFIQGEPGVERPAMTFEDAIKTVPGVGALKQKPTENALKVDFYELRDAVAKAKNTFDDIKLRSPEGLKDFIENEENYAKLALEKRVTRVADELSKIKRAIQQVAAAPEDRFSASEKQERIEQLREVERKILKAVDVRGMREKAMM